MNLPQQTKKLSHYYLDLVKTTSNIKLERETRLAIYKSFGAYEITKVLSNKDNRLFFSPAAKVFGRLAILTARKVMPIWFQFGVIEESEEHYSSDPQQMLEVAEGLLEGNLDAESGFLDLCGRFYNGQMGLERKTQKPVFYAMYASYAALQVFFEVVKGLNNLSCDFASIALTAFAGIDENEVGDWWKQQFKPSIEFSPIKFDPQKRLEFWEWWLNEAIPKAWELAHQSTNQ